MFRRYRQFQALTEREVNEGKRAEAQARRRTALERLDPLDLSATTWPELPPPAIVNAITFAARRGLHRTPDRHAGPLRAALAEAHGIAPERIVAGSGAAQLLAAATQVLLEPGDELVTPWPSYGLYPHLARRAGGRAVPVPGFSVAAIRSAITPRTRVVALCNPNDPTGELLDADELRTLLEALPERVVVLLDEALRHFADREPTDAALALVDELPRLLVVRTLSKAWGLAGLRVGYAVGGEGSGPVLERLAPELGLGELSQAGALEALRGTPDLAAARGRRIARARAELREALSEVDGLDVPAGQANVLWLAARGLAGAELAARLGRQGIAVAAGGPLGDPARVRVTVPHLPEHGERLVRALAVATAGAA
jgi:histidinol-phosphate aminotransferase